MIQSNNLGSLVTTGYLALCVCVRWLFTSMLVAWWWPIHRWNM